MPLQREVRLNAHLEEPRPGEADVEAFQSRARPGDSHASFPELSLPRAVRDRPPRDTIDCYNSRFVVNLVEYAEVADVNAVAFQLP